ncbi:MAG: hypothetical protein AB7N71_06535 [Phycisphaerae bacterium]
MRPLNKLYGFSAAKDFGPLALKAVRDVMIASEQSRRGISLNEVVKTKQLAEKERLRTWESAMSRRNSTSRFREVFTLSV